MVSKSSNDEEIYHFPMFGSTGVRKVYLEEINSSMYALFISGPRQERKARPTFCELEYFCD